MIEHPKSEIIESLSVCIVAYNEAENVARAIESVRGWAGEIIVVDCESTDTTEQIAQDLGATTYRRPNIVPEATKNISFELANREWIFSLDADEVIPETLKREIGKLLAGRPTASGFKIPRRNFYFGAPLRYGGAYPDRQLRLFRRGHGRFPGKGYHERIEIDGSIEQLDHPFDHYPYPSFEVWLRKFDFYTAYGASLLQREKTPITPGTIRHHMITRPLRRWLERLFLKRGIKDGVPGVLAATFDLMTQVVGFGRYWMMTRERQDNL